MGLIVSFPDTAVVRRLWPVEPRTAGSGPRATHRPRRSHVRGRQRPLILEDRRGVGEVQPVLPEIVTSFVLVPLETAEQPDDMHNRTPTQGLARPGERRREAPAGIKCVPRDGRL